MRNYTRSKSIFTKNELAKLALPYAVVYYTYANYRAGIYPLLFYVTCETQDKV